MDPDANLEDRRRLASKIQYQLENDIEPSKEQVIRLTELVIALDDWICERYLPHAWRSPR